MEERRLLKWKVADLGRLLKNSLLAVIRGEFLMRLNISQYFVHILYAFFLIAMIIWISLMTDTTMTKVEKNKELLYEQEVTIAMKEYELTTLNRRSTVANILEQMGSKVTEPEKPATILTK